MHRMIRHESTGLLDWLLLTKVVLQKRAYANYWTRIVLRVFRD
jgi:hypothetical protein